MNPYQQIIQQRHINYLVHFTKSSNLPFILGDEEVQEKPAGIVSDDLLPQEIDRNDTKRNDKHTNYVCCTVEFPNLKFQYWQKKHQEGNLFNEWAFLYIDPKIIDDTTLFSPINAATGNGINLECGPDAFEHLFDQKINYYKVTNYKAGNKDEDEDEKKRMRSMELIRPAGLPSCYTSDIQAEVLIKNKIPKEYIKKIQFPQNTYNYEITRLNLCHIDLSTIKVNSFNENEMWGLEKQWRKD